MTVTPTTNPADNTISRRTSLALLASAAGSFGLLVPNAANAMQVRPVVMDLGATARTMGSQLELGNGFDQAITLEITAREFFLPTTAGGEATYGDGADIVIFPAQAVVAPSATRTVRVQFVGSPIVPKSRHFIITVAQLPVRLPEGESAVQVLYNFQVLVNVGVPGVQSQLEIVSSSVKAVAETRAVPVLTVRNTAQTYGYLGEQRLILTQVDGTGRQIFSQRFSPSELQQLLGLGMVGPGQTREIEMSLDLPSRTGVLSAQLTLERRRR
jgi:fimbrial chaperone protein